ncbi:GNAT family N-acetyltransferase [Nocardioides conyzicola]
MIASALGFDEIDTRTLYEICRLRQQVFVVEQECPYPDLDGRDLEQETRHILMHDQGRLVGYARVLDDQVDGEPVWRIGRVVVAPDKRGGKVGEGVMIRARMTCPDRDIVLDAQSQLVRWYAGMSFAVDGPEFIEDGIPHTPMRFSR